MEFMRDRLDEDEDCPNCGGELSQESCHNGVAMIYGPAGCFGCGWSECDYYDCSDGPKFTDNGDRVGPTGMLTPTPKG